MGCWGELTQFATLMTTEPDIRASGSKGSKCATRLRTRCRQEGTRYSSPSAMRPVSSKLEVRIEESPESQVTAQTKSFHQFESPSHLPSLIRMKSIYVHNS